MEPREPGLAPGQDELGFYDIVESEAIEAIRLGKQLRFALSAMASYLIERAQAKKRI